MIIPIYMHTLEIVMIITQITPCCLKIYICICASGNSHVFGSAFLPHANTTQLKQIIADIAQDHLVQNNILYHRCNISHFAGEVKQCTRRKNISQLTDTVLLLLSLCRDVLDSNNKDVDKYAVLPN